MQQADRLGFAAVACRWIVVPAFATSARRKLQHGRAIAGVGLIRDWLQRCKRIGRPKTDL